MAENSGEQIYSEIIHHPENKNHPGGAEVIHDPNDEIVNEHFSIKQQVQEAKQRLSILSTVVKEIGGEEELMQAAEKEMSAIRDSYIAYKTLINGTAGKQVRHDYIEKNVKPELEALIKGGKLNDSQVETIIRRLNSDLPDVDPDPEELPSYLQRTNSILRECSAPVYESAFKSLENTMRPILEEDDRSILDMIVGNEAAIDLKELNDISLRGLTNEEAKQTVDDFFSYEIIQSRKTDEETGQTTYHFFNKVENFVPFQIRKGNIAILHGYQAVPQVDNLYGDLLTRVDHTTHDITIRNSLAVHPNYRDGGEDKIGALREYFTEDSIRNVLLITVGNPRNADKGYEILLEYYKKPEWHTLLNKTINKYPELSKVRDVLADRQSLEMTSDFYFSLKDAVIPYAETVLTSPSEFSNIKEAAADILPSDVFLELLVTNQILTEAEKEALLNADSVIADLAMQENNYLSSEYYLKQISLLSKKLVLRSETEFNPLMDTYNDFTRLTNFEVESFRHHLQQFARVSQKIIDARDDVDKVQYLTSIDMTNTIMVSKPGYPDRLEFALHIPDYAPSLMSSKHENIRDNLYSNRREVIEKPEDLRFYNTIIGMYGNRAEQIIRGITDCIKGGELTLKDKELTLEFLQKFRVLTPTLIGGFKKAKREGTEEIYIASLEAKAAQLVGSQRSQPETRNDKYTDDLLFHIYSNNVGHWANHERVKQTCLDRTDDISMFTIQPKYEIDLLDAAEIRVKAGETLDTQGIEYTKELLNEVKTFAEVAENNKDTMKQKLSAEIDVVFQASDKSALEVENDEQKLFLLLTDHIYKNNGTDIAVLKSLVLKYEVTYAGNVDGFMERITSDTTSSVSEDYVTLCSLHTYYNDTIKEVISSLAEKASVSEVVSQQMESRFVDLSQEVNNTKQADVRNRLQIDKLGMSESFVKHMSKRLTQRNGRNYTHKEVQAILTRYESLTHGFTDKRELDKNRSAIQHEQQPEKNKTKEQVTQGIYSELQSQKQRTLQAVNTLQNTELNPASVYLGEINLQEYLAIQNEIAVGEYKADEFMSYTAQRVLDIFLEEKLKIEDELDKFESETGDKRSILNGYITKNAESAYARMTGGVCVSGDEQMWNMSNYFQLVLQDPETYKCQGLVLLHHFTEPSGEKILTASLNPSSTYVMSVDEKALFNGMMQALESFASTNNFDKITLSTNPGIRTNRTGGVFEKMMDQRIRDVNKQYTFQDFKQFSYHPNYSMQIMDVVWQNEKVNSDSADSQL